MPLLQRLSEEQAVDPRVREVFQNMQQAVGAVPEPLKLLAVSPGLFQLQTAIIGFYRDHKALSPELLASIRYAAASHFGNRPCILFNASLLTRQGMTDEELETVKTCPLEAPLEAQDQAMLAFVLSAVQGATATEEEMNRLHDFGFSDSDILDAINHGFAMYAPGKILKFFGFSD